MKPAKSESFPYQVVKLDTPCRMLRVSNLYHENILIRLSNFVYLQFHSSS